MRGQRPEGIPRGLTLVESIVASAILAVAITAVFSAVASGRAHAEVAADELAATVAAEDLLARVLSSDFDRIDEWNGHEEAPGELVDAKGVFLAPPMQRVGRRVRVERRTHTIFESNAIPGRAIFVEIFDREQRTTGSISRWIPDPEPDS
jgi:prepilin-type N-terminal cleavage/methylation domain-containing protein